MLNETQNKLLNDLLSTLSHDQTIWMLGYLQGRLSNEASSTAVVPVVDKPRVNLYYATETGNAKGVTLMLMKALKADGYKVKNTAVNRLKPETIPTDEIAIFLASTHGEGDPPESALKFFNLLKALPDGTMNGLAYAVMGLGDKSYEIFCGAATDLDKELVRLGGKAFQDIALFDVDYSSHTPAWIDNTVQALNAHCGATSIVAPTVAEEANELAAPLTGKGYSRLDPVCAKVQHIVNLNDNDSNKKTFHIELSYDDAIIYTPGDAVGVILPKDANGADQTPRLYSIASAPSMHQGEVHLTVALATYEKEDGSTGYGIASKFLSDLKEGDIVQIYISQNQVFNLPANDTDAIMIGPGTGVAPFRSFVLERSERGAEGRNWLFFGDQYAHCDFLYQSEWQEHLATESLTRLDLAFSRDQSEKVYVQHKMKAAANDLMEWLDGGAAIYVCGAKDPMSRDVEATLIDILKEKKDLSDEQAEEYLGALEDSGRYLKDVY